MQYEIVGLPCQLEKNQKMIGVIGPRTKKTTPRNLQNAYDFGVWCAQNGYIPVSGLADGVDGKVHEGALNAGGKTIAVVSTTANQPITPSHHRELAVRIRKNGCIVHPFAMNDAFDVPRLSGGNRRLIERNFLIAALCPTIVAVEREQKMITGGTRWAMNAGIWFGKHVCRIGDGGVYELDKTPLFKRDAVWWDVEIRLPNNLHEKIKKK